MNVSGYGDIRFGMEWPITVDLQCKPGYVVASVWYNPEYTRIESAIIIAKDKITNRIQMYVFQYYDDIVPIDDDTELEIIFDSRKDN